MTDNHNSIKIINYLAHGIAACAVHEPKYHWHNFAPRFADSRECKLLGQTPEERLIECIKNRFPAAQIKIINEM